MEQTVSTSDERTYAMLCHLLAFAGLFIPFGNFIGPLVMWLAKRNESEFVNDQGKESLNFQISYGIYMIVVGIGLIFSIGDMSAVILAGSIMGVLVLVYFIFMIIASVKASEGKSYRYPLTIRIIN